MKPGDTELNVYTTVETDAMIEKLENKQNPQNTENSENLPEPITDNPQNTPPEQTKQPPQESGSPINFY